MNKLYSNHNHTLCHPEAAAEGSGHKSTMSSRFFTTLRMTVCLLSSGMTAVVLACLLLTTSTQAKWGDNCTLNGGTIIKANEYGNDKGGKCNDPNNPDLTNNCNGMEFCMSNKAMNWWSAFAWCESIGGKLAGLSSLCPHSAVVSDWNNKNACPNFKATLNESIWTSVGSLRDRAYWVDTSGAIYDGGGAWDNKRTKALRAVCEEN